MPNVGRRAGSAARGPLGGRSPVRGLGARLAVIVAVLGLWAGPVRAAVLVLGVHEDGQPRARARALVAQHLSRMGEAAREPSLSSEELACTESACLARLARAHRAERIVGGELLPNDRTYLVRMWLYDTVAQQPASTEDRCIECSPDQAYELAARLAGRLLDSAAAAPDPNQAPPPPLPPRSEPQHAPLATPPVAQPVSATPTSVRCAKRVYTFGRGVAVGALGALTAAGLATAIGLHAADGSVYLPAGDYGDGSNLPADVEHRFGSNYRLAYGLTAVTALGLTAALLPWHKILPREGGARQVQCPSTRSKWTFNRGLIVGSLSSLLLGGLVTAAATQALDGGTYQLGDVNVPYRFQSVYTAGYVLSGGLALGLGVSLLWP